MERGDGFWTSENKGWKTRREEQDRYRRALDDQIEERRKMNPKSKVRPGPSETTETPKTETPKIQDPVQHLLPWLNNPASSTPVPPPAPIVQQHGPHATHYPAAQPATPSYYYVANPLPVPQQGQPMPAPQPQQPPGAFAYFGSTPLPPPAEFAPFIPPPNTAYQQQQQAGYQHQQQHHHQQQQQSTVVPAGYHHPQVQYVPPGPNTVSLPPTQGPQQPQSGHPQPTQHQQAQQPSAPIPEQETPTPEKDLLKKKIHVSQTSEELPTSTQTLAEYRKELAKQVEEKRRQDEERLKREEEEEERLQIKIQQDQERLRQRHEAELRRVKEKEEEERRKAKETVKNFEASKMKLDAEAEAEKQRQKNVSERQQQLKDAASNSRAALSTSPSRYYARVEDRENGGQQTSSWAWESTVVPTVKQRAKNPINIINHLELEEGGAGAGSSGDHHLNKRDNSPAPFAAQGQQQQRYQHHVHHQHVHPRDRQLPSLPQSGRKSIPSVRTSARSGLSRIDGSEFEGDFDETESNAATTSRTYNCEDKQSSVGGGDGGPHQHASKSSEKVMTEDMMMCPRCARSFSSTDVQYPQSPGERLKFLNFLDNIHKQLREDKARLLRNEFDWNTINKQ